MLDPSAYAILAPIAAIAGFVRGFAGFGGPLLLLPALIAFLPPAASVAATMWVDLFANVRLVPQVWREVQPSIVVPLLAGTMVAMPLGVWLLVAVDPAIMKRGISLAILAAALALLSGWRYRGEVDAIGWFSVGALTGVVMGATSLAVTAALFLHAGSLTARESRANFVVWAFVSSLALLFMLAFGTGISNTPFLVIGILGPIYVAGTFLGARLNKRVPDAIVRRAVLVLVVVIATVGLLF